MGFDQRLLLIRSFRKLGLSQGAMLPWQEAEGDESSGFPQRKNLSMKVRVCVLHVLIIVLIWTNNKFNLHSGLYLTILRFWQFGLYEGVAINRSDLGSYAKWHLNDIHTFHIPSRWIVCRLTISIKENIVERWPSGGAKFSGPAATGNAAGENQPIQVVKMMQCLHQWLYKEILIDI